MLTKKTFFVLMRMCLVVLSAYTVSATSSVSLSDQGTDVRYNSNGSIVNNGNLEVTIYDSLAGGNLIYNETFANVIRNGGTAIVGQVRITGLPFNSSSESTSARGWGSAGATALGSITVTAGMTYLQIVVDANTNYLFLLEANAETYGHTPTINAAGKLYGFGTTYITDA
jgi:hypothetical protein